MGKFENADEWIEAELNETLDEMFEAEFNEPILSQETREYIKKIYRGKKPKTLENRVYFKNLLKLQGELIKLQNWVENTGAKILIICEGRDSAGKGGVIKRITQRLNPRVARVVALPPPSEREQTQWYFQRYVPHLPAGGEIVLFDRSWYNRAGVEKVMEFATKDQVEQFYRDVPDFERMLIRSGIILLKYWFSISDEEQQLRFLMRANDPLKQWKLSDVDLMARIHWEKYTKAKEAMFKRTNTKEAPWYIVEGNDKKRERLNCIEHILSMVPYKEIQHEPVNLPERIFNPDYERRVLPDKLYVPKIY